MLNLCLNVLQFKNKCTLFLRRASFLLTLLCLHVSESRLLMLHFELLFSPFTFMPPLHFPFPIPSAHWLSALPQMQARTAKFIKNGWLMEKNQHSMTSPIFLFQSFSLFFFFNPLNTSYCIFPLYCTSSFKTKTLHLASAIGYPRFKSQTNVSFHFLCWALTKRAYVTVVLDILNFKAKNQFRLSFPPTL